MGRSITYASGSILFHFYANSFTKAIENLKYRGINREMIYLIFIIVLISTIIKNNTSYAFFWQDMALESVYL